MRIETVNQIKELNEKGKIINYNLDKQKEIIKNLKKHGYVVILSKTSTDLILITKIKKIIDLIEIKKDFEELGYAIIETTRNYTNKAGQKEGFDIIKRGDMVDHKNIACYNLDELKDILEYIKNEV